MTIEHEIIPIHIRGEVLLDHEVGENRRYRMKFYRSHNLQIFCLLEFEKELDSKSSLVCPSDRNYGLIKR
jgi:hypothetical protein